MLEFVWPWVFLCAPLPWLMRWLAPPANETGAALRAPFYRDVAALETGGHLRAGRGRYVRWLAYFAWLALLVAAARPQWLGEAVDLPVSGRSLMLAVDISGSMERPDFDLSGREATRLDVVKAVANRFIERRVGDRLGLILFGTRAYLQTPLTFDRTTVTAMLDQAQIGLAGKDTAIGDAIGLAVKRLANNEERDRVVVLLTDGANTAGEVSPARAAQLAASAGLRIYTIGIGAERIRIRSMFGQRTVNPSTDLDEETLRAIAATTGGVYFRARDTAALESIYRKLDELEPVASDSEYFRPFTELYVWPLGVGLVLTFLIAARRLPWRRRGALDAVDLRGARV